MRSFLLKAGVTTAFFSRMSMMGSPLLWFFFVFPGAGIFVKAALCKNRPHFFAPKDIHSGKNAKKSGKHGSKRKKRKAFYIRKMHNGSQEKDEQTGKNGFFNFQSFTLL